jgi:hypothetical protein
MILRGGEAYKSEEDRQLLERQKTGNAFANEKNFCSPLARNAHSSWAYATNCDRLSVVARLRLSTRFELACMLVRVDHVASIIVNANHRIM